MRTFNRAVMVFDVVGERYRMIGVPEHVFNLIEMHQVSSKEKSFNLVFLRPDDPREPVIRLAENDFLSDYERVVEVTP